MIADHDIVATVAPRNLTSLPAAILSLMTKAHRLASLLPAHLGNDITIDSKHNDVLEQMKVRYVVSGWFYQQLIISDDRIVDELLGYQNAAARRVDTFSHS